MSAGGDTVPCEHCGTPFKPRAADERFCCNGCGHVYAIIHEGGFERFYEIGAGARLRPVEGLAFEQRDYGWLAELAAAAEGAAGEGGAAALELSLSGVSCAACVWLIEKLADRSDGAPVARVDAGRGAMSLSWEPGAFDPVALARELQGYGYEVGPPGAVPVGDASLIKRVSLCAAFAMNAMAFTLPRYLGMPEDFVLAGLFEFVAAISATLAMAVGGSYFISRAVRALQAGAVHIDLPIALGVTAAFGGSLFGWVAGYEPLLYFDFVAIFIFLMLGGRWLQERTLARSRNRLAERHGVPDTFRPADGGAPQPLASIAPGTRYLLRPGALVPVASTVAREAPFGLGWISGEAEAPPVPPGGTAPSGSTYLGSGEATLIAREGWDSSLLKRLTAGAKAGGAEAAGDPRLARIISRYIAAVIAVGFGGAAWWLLASELPVGEEHERPRLALQVAVSLFVVSCPCALGVALPLAERLAAAAAARVGAYPQRHGFWPRLARVRKAVFDKTGTLTLGRPALVSEDAIDWLDDRARSALVRLAGTSPHPVSRALAEELAARRVGAAEFADCEVAERPGRGLALTGPDGAEWRLERDERALADAVFARGGETLARFEFRDVLREDAGEQVAALRRTGIEVYLMSGDREEKVRPVAEQLGIPPEHWRARMSPDQKAAWVRELDARDTLYLGDGANDSLAFDVASCTATPATEVGLLQDKADLYFLGRGLGWLGAVLPIARRRRRAVRRVVAFSVAYNLAAAALALSGHMNPLLAAILMPLSSAATVGIVVSGLKARAGSPAGGRPVSRLA